MVQHLAGPFIWSGGMDRMGSPSGMAGLVGQPAFREKGLVIVKVAGSFSNMSE
jgi:hypothetical protein